MAEVIGQKSKKKYRMEIDEKGTKRTFYDESGKEMDEATFKAGEGGFDRTGGSERAIKEGYTVQNAGGYGTRRKPKEAPRGTGADSADLGGLAARIKRKNEENAHNRSSTVAAGESAPVGTVGDQADAIEDKKKKAK